jgi:hypothetical protein
MPSKIGAGIRVRKRRCGNPAAKTRTVSEAAALPGVLGESATEKGAKAAQINFCYGRRRSNKPRLSTKGWGPVGENANVQEAERT